MANQLAQIAQGTNSDRGSGLLTQRGALNRIEHPIRHGDLHCVLQLDDDGRLPPVSESANYLDFLTEERVMAIANLAVPRVMSSVLTP